MTDTTPLVPATGGGAPENRLSYDGRAGPMAGLVLRTTLLTILTLGIYRFWAKTRIRRFLWTHLSFRGERLEYTGRGIELFLGFLIVIGLVMAITLIQTVAELALASTVPYIDAITGLVWLPLIVYLVPVARYRARRYRLSRTLWRGVRAGQGGSSARYGLVAFGYQILSFLTLGLIAPLMRLRLFARRMNETWFGDRRFAFDGRASDLFPVWMTVWLPRALAAGVFAYIAYLAWDDVAAMVMNMEADGQTGDKTKLILSPEVRSRVAIALLVSGVLVVLSLIAYVRYRAIEYRYVVGRTTFGNLRFTASLRAWQVVRLYLPYVAAMVALLIAVGAAFGGVAGLSDPAIAGVIPFAMVAVVVFVGPILQYVLVVNRFAGLLCATLTIEGEQDFEAILQSARTAPKRGEGLAEFLDVGDI